MKTSASEMFTLALQVYTPPWLVRRGSKVSIPVALLGGVGDMVTPSIVPLWISCPPGPSSTITGGALRGCIKVAVQVTVSRLPAVKLPVVVMVNTGSAGAAARREGR